MTGLWDFSWNVNCYCNRVPQANNCFPARYNCERQQCAGQHPMRRNQLTSVEWSIYFSTFYSEQKLPLTCIWYKIYMILTKNWRKLPWNDLSEWPKMFSFLRIIVLEKTPDVPIWKIEDWDVICPSKQSLGLLIHSNSPELNSSMVLPGWLHKLR